MTPYSRWSRSGWLSVVALATAYVLSGKLGLQFAHVHASATPLWPPTGIALAALLVGGYRLWPGVFAGAFLVNITTAGSVATSLGIAGGNTLEALVGVYLVGRLADGRRAFALPRTIFAFIVAAGLAAPAVSATIGVSSLTLGGSAAWTDFGPIWLTWWFGDAAGALVLAPLLIVWANEPRLVDIRARLGEAVALVVVTISISAVVFGGVFRTGADDAPLAFLCLPPLVWAAYRFGPRGGTTALSMLSVIAAVGTVQGHGPFSIGRPNESLLILQAFLVTMSGTVLPLAALSEELARREARSAENARLYREMQHTGEITRSITSSLDLDTVLQRIAEGARELCGSDTAAMFLRDGESTGVVPRCRVGPPVKAYEGLRIEPGRGIGGQVLLTGRPLRTNHYVGVGRVPRAFHAIAEETGTEMLMVVPIAILDRVEGLLYLSNRTPRPFTENDEVVCMRLAEQAAAAIRNARLFSDAETARADAEAASRAKDEFLAVLSHELRTPLTAIVGWARMLRTGTMSPGATRDAIEVIDRNAAVQTQLIEDLLDVSRIISRTLKVELRPVKLAPVLGAAVDAVRLTADRKGVDLSLDVAAGIGLVSADPGRLQQVFWNLLVNAVKFTPTGGSVAVTATVAHDGVRASVADTGGGIDPAVLPHIFDRFRQADSSMTRQHGGLGLGLALVKHLVELHGGRVSAESAGLGQGATFTVTLRHAAAAEAPLEPSTPTPPPSRLQLAGVTVLIVDDEADTRTFCADVLARHGARVMTAESVAQALERVESANPDVVITDLGMPDEDGFALIRRLRARDSDRGRRVVVMALTAYVSDEDRLRVLAAGFDGHIAKPFDPEKLARAVHAFIRPS